MQPYPAAILLDLDDTLISFDGVSNEAWDTACTEFCRDQAPGFTQDILYAGREKLSANPEESRSDGKEACGAGRHMDWPLYRHPWSAAPVGWKPLAAQEISLVRTLDRDFQTR